MILTEKGQQMKSAIGLDRAGRRNNLGFTSSSGGVHLLVREIDLATRVTLITEHL